MHLLYVFTFSLGGSTEPPEPPLNLPLINIQVWVIETSFVPCGQTGKRIEDCCHFSKTTVNNTNIIGSRVINHQQSTGMQSTVDYNKTVKVLAEWPTFGPLVSADSVDHLSTNLNIMLTNTLPTLG